MPKGSKLGTPDITLKISLGGEPEVGKSSSVRRFVTNTFEDGYVSTLGTKVSSRRFSVPDPERPEVTHQVGAAVWDVMGTPEFRDILREAYYRNTAGVLLVCDCTRLETMYRLPEWYETVRRVCGEVPAVMIVNKTDLATERTVIQKAADAMAAEMGWPWLATSAKTGENIEAAFRLVVQLYLVKARRKDTDASRPTVATQSVSANKE